MRKSRCISVITHACFNVLEEKDMRSRFDKPDITELPAELRIAEDFTVADLEGDGDVEEHIWVEEKTFSAWLQVTCRYRKL